MMKNVPRAEPTRSREEADALFSEHVAFAFWFAKRMQAKTHAWRDLSYEFGCAALEGLWRAALVYDTRIGDFCGYAKVRMRSAILDWLRSEERIGTRKSKRWDAVPVVQSLEQMAGEIRHPAFVDPLADDPADVAADDAGEGVLLWFREGRERDILRAYFVEGMKMVDVGRRYGISASRVCQVVTRAVERVREERLRAGDELAQRRA